MQGAYAAVKAVMITATAYVVDFNVIPKRLAPGFERRLSRRSLLMVYVAFALGLVTVALVDRYGKAPKPKSRRPRR